MPQPATGTTAERKRHHFVSVTYLNAWVCGSAMKLHAYRSENASNPLHIRPDEIAFENYYYSQTRPDGTRGVPVTGVPVTGAKTPLLSRDHHALS